MRANEEHPTMAVQPSNIDNQSLLTELSLHRLINLPLNLYTTSNSSCCKVNKRY